jgi:hypothetical protein
MLPDKSFATVRESFLKCGYNNERALWRIDSMQKTSNTQEMEAILANFEKAYDVSKDSKSYEFFYGVKTDIYKEIYDKDKTWDEKRQEAVYLFALFLHRVYLYNAEQGSLRIKSAEGRDLYKQLAAGEVNECLKSKNNEEFPWGHIAALLIVVVLAIGLIALIWMSGKKKKAEPVPPAKKTVISKQITPEKTAVTSPKSPIVTKPAEKIVLAPPPPIKKATQADNYEAVIEKMTELEKEQPAVPIVKQEVKSPVPDIELLKQDKDTSQVIDIIYQQEAATEAEDENALYLGLPQGNFFHRIYPEHLPYETFFILSINPNDKSMATFTLTNDNETLKYLLTMPEVVGQACHFVDRAPASPSLMFIESPGQAKLVHGFWQIEKRIISKIKI